MLSKTLRLEGDYSSWAVYDSIKDTGYYAQYSCAIFDKDEAYLIIFEFELDEAYSYVISTKTLSVVSTDLRGILYSPGEGWKNRSLRGMYIVVPEDAGIKIFKDGVLAQTITKATLDFNVVYGMAAVSPSGKYIAVKGRYVDTSYYGWVVLEGS